MESGEDDTWEAWAAWDPLATPAKSDPATEPAEAAEPDAKDDPWDPIGPPGPRVPRPKRVPYFARPKPPRDWRWAVGGIGKSLITLGLLMFAFVAYQLWGTGIQTARAQNSLENEFEERMAATTTSSSTLPDQTTLPTTTVPVPTTSTIPTAPATPPIPDGDLVGRIEIPSIDADYYVVEGVGKKDLQKGPGHFKETPMPGQLGNAAIAGHRTTYLAPFSDLDDLNPGDRIEFTSALGAHFTYAVTDSVVVEPSEYGKVIPTTDATVATLTLATCTPKGTATHRLIVRATIVPEESDQVLAPPSNTVPVTTGTLPDEGTVETAPTATDESMAPTDSVPSATTLPADGAVTPIDDGLIGGWFDDSAAIPHAIGWGALLLLVGIGAFFAGRAVKKLYVSFLVGAVPFVIVLYFFFENVNRLLPSGL